MSPTNIRVPACLDRELFFPRFLPEETQMIRAEVEKPLGRGIIHPSKSPWDAFVLCVRKKGGTLRLCVDWCRL